MSIFTKKPHGTFLGNLLRSISSVSTRFNGAVDISVSKNRKNIELENLNKRSSNIDDLVRSQNLL
nr:hypothetical protein [Pedobacter sp. ASV2]